MLEVGASIPVLPGELLAGKYRVERLIGQGAMGTVVAARHLLIDQQVAIKFLRQDRARDQVVAERFRREARAAAKIKGEHVVRVFDVGEVEGGGPFLVMEYVEGMNLAELLAAEGPPEPAVAVDYVLQACDALAQAHAAGIIHRDVKPSNLFVTARSDGRPLVKVLDFGISKVSAPDGKPVTLATSVLGSPHYISPEQVMSSRDVDARSDIWSVGVVLYELLTGALPFTGDSVSHVFERVRDMSAPSLRKLRAEVPAGLERVVLRCLEKDPRNRYATLPDLITALRPFGPGARGAAERPARANGAERDPDGTLVSRRPRGVARARRTIALSGVAVVAIAAIVGGVISRHRGRPPARQTSAIPALAPPDPSRALESASGVWAGQPPVAPADTTPAPTAAPVAEPPRAAVRAPVKRHAAAPDAKAGYTARATADPTPARSVSAGTVPDGPPALPGDRK
jgi:serine/threonine-protein kinase